MTYDAIILADSPVSDWTLADPSGTVAADSADSNAGAYNGGFTLGGAAPYPNMDGSTAFTSASSANVTVPDATNLHFTAYTLECWIKTSSTAAAYIIAKDNPTTPFAGYILGFSQNGTTGQIAAWCGGGSWFAAGPNLADGVWHYVAVTLTGTTVTLYVGGGQVGQTTQTPSLTTSQTLTISGNPASGAGGISGSISSVAVYSSALNSTQIAAHAWAAIPSLSLGTLAKPTSPVLQSAWSSSMLAAYNLGEGSSTAADLSGNAHTGTLTGSCTWTSSTYGNQLTLADNSTTGSYLSIGTLSALSGVTEWTFSALCQLDTYTDSPRGINVRVLIGTSRAAAGYPQSAILYRASDRTIRFNIRYSNFTDMVAPAPPLNTWILITARVTSAHVASLWYDNVKVAETTNASFVYASDVLPGGALGDMPTSQTGNNWSGLIAMGLFATRGYTDAEIIALAADPFVWSRAPQSAFPAALLPVM